MGSPTHGQWGSRTYNSWAAMKRRCNDPKQDNYMCYGGRGIKICDRWNKFENFREDMGDRPEGHTLDRMDVNGNYCAENCKWSNLSDQRKNIRSHKIGCKKKHVKRV